MVQVTLAWWFKTPAPLSVEDACKALEPLGIEWIKRDSDYERDSIAGRLTEGGRARIFQIGLRGWVVNLTVTAERAPDLELQIAAAKSKLFREVLPLLEAGEIMEAQPEGN